jgi:hypothetical protein
LAVKAIDDQIAEMDVDHLKDQLKTDENNVG